MNLRILTLGVFAMCSGCSSLPSVTYSNPDANPKAPAKAVDIDNVPPTYALWTTSLEFKKTADSAMTVAAAAVPVSKDPFVFAIVGDTFWYKTDTTISLSTQANSELLSSVAVTVTDNRATYISTAAEVLGVALKIGGIAALDANTPTSKGCHINTVPSAPAPAAAFDKVFNLLDALTALDGTTADCSMSDQRVAFMIEDVSDGGALATVSIDKAPASAIPLTTDNIALLIKTAKKVFLYPACRTGTVVFNYQPTTPKQEAGKPAPATPAAIAQTANFLFSDPRYVQAIAMPSKGTLTVKSQCGMTAGADSGTPDATPGVTKALADALQSLAGGSSSAKASPAKSNATNKVQQ